MKKCNESQRAWVSAEQHKPRPPGKNAPSFIASVVNDVADSRRAKSASQGSLKFKREHLK